MADPAAGLRAWSSFRDRVVDQLRAEGKDVVAPVKGVHIRSEPRRKPWWRFWS